MIMARPLPRAHVAGRGSARDRARPFPARRLGVSTALSSAAHGSRGRSPTGGSPTARRATDRSWSARRPTFSCSTSTRSIATGSCRSSRSISSSPARPQRMWRDSDDHRPGFRDQVESFRAGVDAVRQRQARRQQFERLQALDDALRIGAAGEARQPRFIASAIGATPLPRWRFELGFAAPRRNRFRSPRRLPRRARSGPRRRAWGRKTAPRSSRATAPAIPP